MEIEHNKNHLGHKARYSPRVTLYIPLDTFIFTTNLFLVPIAPFEVIINPERLDVEA
jgi:hypothetical protein